MLPNLYFKGLKVYRYMIMPQKILINFFLDMSKWVDLAHTGWFTMSRVENEWTQLGSLYGESEILQPGSTHHGLVG